MGWHPIGSGSVGEGGVSCGSAVRALSAVVVVDDWMLSPLLTRLGSAPRLLLSLETAKRGYSTCTICVSPASPPKHYSIARAPR